MRPERSRPAMLDLFSRPALTQADLVLARIRRKAPQHRTDQELVLEEILELREAFPHEWKTIRDVADGWLPSVSRILVEEVPL